MFRDDVLEVRVRVGNMLGYLEFFVLSYFGTDFTEMVDFGHLVFFIGEDRRTLQKNTPCCCARCPASS